MRRGEDGFTTVEWALSITVLIIPVAFLVLSFAGWSQRTAMARLMAQEAARSVVLAPDGVEGAAAAEAISRQIATNYGLGDAWCATPGPGCVSMQLGGEFARGGEITVRVEVPVPALTVPFFGDFAAFQWATTHTERIDDFRSFP